MGWFFNFLANRAVEPPKADIPGSLAFDPIPIPAMPDKLPVLSVTFEQFAEVVEIVIDNFEGGYYHPDMLKNFKPSDQDILRSSGETMFGEDRKAGAALAKYPEWGQLWAMIDKDRAKHPHLWKYQYRGGELNKPLKYLVAKIMYKWFSYLAGRHILIFSMDEIAADKRLQIHFCYASWNGEGWFQKYSKALNAAIAKYPGDKEAIFHEAIKARTKAPSKAIRQQGQHMMELFKKLKLV